MMNATLDATLDTTMQEQLPLSVGQLLRDARSARGLTLEQVSKSLCISKRQLSKLEEDEKQLVCDVYTLGFVKLYAQHLGLNAQDMVEKFRDQVTHTPQSSHLAFPAPLPGRGMPTFRTLGLALFVLAAIIIGWRWISNFSPAPYPQLESILHKNADAITSEVGKPAPLLRQQPDQQQTEFLTTPPEGTAVSVEDGPSVLN